jgi:hypothetical protein
MITSSTGDWRQVTDLMITSDDNLIKKLIINGR